jgi:hypothetical protein
MNNTSSKNKSWIWVLVIVIIAGLAYYFYSNSTPTPLVSASSDTVVDTQVISLLNQISTLQIDSSIFNDPGYKTLRDYSVAIPSDNVGRPNPFAPLPGDVVVQVKAKK